MKIGLIC
jgi:hypothetical protein